MVYTNMYHCFGSALSLVAGYTLTRDEHEENAANPDTKVWKAN